MKYKVGDHVVVRNYDRHEIGVVTNKRTSKGTASSGKTVAYDIRTERGSALPIVCVDKNRANITIDSKLTDSWVGSDSDTSLHVHKNVGHLRANYSPDIIRSLDGDNGKIGHYEKANDFIFNVQGARSY